MEETSTVEAVKETMQVRTVTATAIADQHSQPIQVTAGSRDVTRAGNGNGISVATNGAGETRVCLEIIPVKVRGKSNTRLLRHMPFLTMGERRHYVMNS